MNHIFADHPDHIRVVTALRSTGARIYEARDGFYCEVRSTLRAMGVSRKAGLRRIVDSGAPFTQRFLLLGGTSKFVTDADIKRLLVIFDRAPHRQEALIRRLQRKHGRVLRYLSWPYLAMTCGFMSAHPAVRAWLQWYCIDLIPALLRHGHYDPATNHEPPPSRLLDALEFREEGREMCNQYFPGLGDALAGDVPQGDPDEITDWDRVTAATGDGHTPATTIKWDRILYQAACYHDSPPSTLIHTALQRVLSQVTPMGTPSASPLDDTWVRLVMALPPDVQQAIRQAVTGTGLPLERVLKALIITACQPKMTPS